MGGYRTAAHPDACPPYATFTCPYPATDPFAYSLTYAGESDARSTRATRGRSGVAQSAGEVA